MELQNLFSLLEGNPYPGRGILIGKNADGKHAVVAYFIMGRSENSRNRIFVTEGEGIRTQAYDPAKLTDPSLVIYAPVRVLGNTLIVTNGDQTDTVYEHIASGKNFEDALRKRTFEPDGPNFTPRISGIASRNDGGFFYKLSILKSARGNGESAQRYFFEYPQPFPGEGHFISTYETDGDPLPSFAGQPREVFLSGDMTDFTNKLWHSLNEDNKVSLFVRFVNLEDGKSQTMIKNKHCEG